MKEIFNTQFVILAVVLLVPLVLSIIAKNIFAAYESYWSAKWNQKESNDNEGEEWKNS